MSDLQMLFLFFIEESTAALFLALVLLGTRPRFKRVATMGVLQGIAVYIIRSGYKYFHIPFGTHVIFTIMTMIIIIKYGMKSKWGTAITGGLLAFISIAISEAVMVPILMKGLNWKLEGAQSNLSTYLLTSYFGDLLMFLGALLVGVTGFSVLKKA